MITFPFGNSVVIPAGQSNVDLTITPVDDNIPEPTETVTVDADERSGAHIGTPKSATVWIADNHSTSNSPIVTLVASDPIAAWGGSDTGMFVISRDRSTNAPVEVSFTVGGTAVSGVDYFAITNPVTIPNGSVFRASNDSAKGQRRRGSKTIVATLTILGSYRSAPGYSADTVTLVNCLR